MGEGRGEGSRAGAPPNSRSWSRADHRISTLRRSVEALGGSLEICAVVDGRRIKLAEG